jgi:PKD repeat protein
VVSPNAPPTCPTFTVSPTTGPAPLNVTASGSCSDPENDITSTTITWGDGTSTPGTSGAHTYSTAGSFTVTLTATDSAGNTGSSASQTVTVQTQNHPPTCTLQVSPDHGNAPLPVTASGNCTDPQNQAMTTVLNWGDGTTTNSTSGTHTFTTPGNFMVVLTATDSGGLSGSASHNVTVSQTQNLPPTCSLSVSPTGGQVPVTVTVTPNCSDPENDISSIVVDFGDGFYGSVSVGSTLSHTFTWAGTFQVTVTASDTAGNTSQPSSQTVSTSDTPTMFVAVSNGQVKQFDESGKALKTLNTNQGGTVTGMAFDWLDSLYATDFTADAVTKFNGNGDVTGNFGSGYNCQPESIVFDNTGNAYVGQTGCSHALLKFDAYGNLAAVYSVTTEVEGSDWIDIAADQCTIYYTSQGTTVFRFNACTGQQESPLATGLSTGLGIKILPDGSVLAANKQDIIHFDSAGQVVTKYNAAGESCWVSLALDPDGKSFWAVDYCSSDVVRFDISSGNQVAKFSSGTSTNNVFGIGMRGPGSHLTPAGPLIASPQNITAATGQSASFTLGFVPSGGAVDQTFTFSCANLPVGTSCQFSPQNTKVGKRGTTVQVTITTTGSGGAQLRMLSPRFFAWWVLLSGVLFAGEIRPRSRGIPWKWIGVVLIIAAIAGMIACGGVTKNAGGKSGNGSNGTPSASSTTPASTYAIVVRATSSSSQSSTVVNLTVQ